MSTDTRTKTQEKNNPGIYVGVVVNHLDTTMMGGVEVELTKRSNSGNLVDYVQCHYASPFFGSTPASGMSKNDGYADTQKSYGFWAVPPDIGSRVIVLMPEGDFSKAYWIACIPDTGTNFMTPGNASTTYNKDDTSVALPVGEYNKLQEKGEGGDPTKFLKPVNTVEKERLEKAGLDKDHIRGTNTSSARREAPSHVFGWSSPGPLDMAGPTHSYGKPGRQVNRPFNRLGGSSFVMDDGDPTLVRKKPARGEKGVAGKMEYANIDAKELDGDDLYPASDLMRLKTRNGHQILMHNTEDLIYISHGSGNSWIEMSANGKIDIYAKDSISMRSEQDINFYADRNINFEAKKDVNITSGVDTYIHAVGSWNILADVDGKLAAVGDTNIHAGGDHKETTEGKIYMNSSTSADEAGKAKVPVRVPAHEPWRDHENLDPENFLPEETVAKAYDDPEDKEARQGLLDNGTTDEDKEFPKVPDTFIRQT